MSLVLIISGDDGSRYLYRAAISYQKIEVDASPGIAEGIKKALSKKPDLIVVDGEILRNLDEKTREKTKGVIGIIPTIVLWESPVPKIKEGSGIFEKEFNLSKEHNSLKDLIRIVQKIMIKKKQK